MTFGNGLYSNTEQHADETRILRRRRRSLALMLPREIVWQIFLYLAPADFNSARRVSRSWFRISLQPAILSIMLRHGGWSSSISNDYQWDQTPSSINWWRTSRRIDREFAFSPHPSAYGLHIPSILSTTTSRTVEFHQCSTIDFRSLANQNTSTTPEIFFTVSSCGKYLVVASHCLVYIYILNQDRNPHGNVTLPGALELIESFECPERVIACSMRSSSRHSSIAILLDGRVALVYDITTTMADLSSSKHPPLNRHPSSDRDDLHYNTQRASRAVPSKRASSVYRDICSAEDPPISVDLCPQKRCVVFGSAEGVELHWVDTSTKKSHRRWFSLNSPSGFVFFLALKTNATLWKLFSLLSCSAGLEKMPALYDSSCKNRVILNSFSEKFRCSTSPEGPEDVGGYYRILINFQNNTTAQPPLDISNYSGHYRVVPLSDSCHVLFIDPATNLLCLGMVVSAAWPTKILLKVSLQGGEKTGRPITYVAGSNLEHGVRIAVGFEMGSKQSIWIFSLPEDALSADQGPWKSDEGLYFAWPEWWPKHVLHDRLNTIDNRTSHRNTWPMRVEGQEIGRMDDLVELAVDSSSDLTVWAFGNNGSAKVWKFDSDSKVDATRWQVVCDGTVRKIDAENDIEMVDAPLAEVSDQAQQCTSKLADPDQQVTTA
ncbi:hypothetical protein B7463_g4993, partial [Scytalidium lignicola]